MAHESPSERLKWAREQHGKYKTPTDAARAFGFKISTYLGHENGDRNPSRATAKRYGRAYRVRWEWLLEGEGAPTMGTSARIVARISDNALLIFYPSDQIADTAELPPGGTSSTVAIAVSGISMRGIADEGWLIYFDDERRPPSRELVGKLCVLETDSGEVMVRTLQPGRKKARYDLEAPNAATLRDRRVKWAARVTWIKPR